MTYVVTYCDGDVAVRDRSPLTNVLAYRKTGRLRAGAGFDENVEVGLVGAAAGCYSPSLASIAGVPAAMFWAAELVFDELDEAPGWAVWFWAAAEKGLRRGAAWRIAAEVMRRWGTGVAEAACRAAGEGIEAAEERAVDLVEVLLGRRVAAARVPAALLRWARQAKGVSLADVCQVVTLEVLAAQDERCGAHSGIPACCVRFFLTGWRDEQVRAGEAFDAGPWFAYSDRVAVEGGFVRPGYVMCPGCIEAMAEGVAPATVLPCTCGKNPR